MDEIKDEWKQCPDCKGNKTFNYSNCCGASIILEDICSNCKEHCSEMDCENCLGSGEVPKEFDDFTDAQEYFLDQADDKYDEFKLNN